jgi:transducin (beta)-like 1
MVMAVRWNKRGDLLLSGGLALEGGIPCGGCVAVRVLVLLFVTCKAEPQRRDWMLLARNQTLPSTHSPCAGSLDGSLIVWDAKAGQQSKAYSHHGAPIVDADWRNNTMFASCSQDGSIAVCKLSDGKPLRHWQGAHSADINSLRWEPSGKLLASCSDDGTVKVWQATSDKPVHTLSGHVGSVTAVRWGQSSSGKSHLASCGDDGSVRVWDAEAGACVHVFDEHASAVTLIAWSPDATYLASGDASGRLLVWSLRSGGVVRSMQAPSTVYDLRFNKDSSLLACCTSETQPILVADLRRQA